MNGVTTDPAAPTIRKPERGDELELRVDALAFGGNGVARLQLGDRGYVLFVRGAVPGDLVRAVVTKRKRDYGEARTIEVLERGPDRIDPVADHAGAPWQILPYERQLEVKQQQVDEALRRLGRLDGFELEPIVPAIEQWRYRNKLEYSYGTGAGRAARSAGSTPPGSWEQIDHIEDCLLASERGNELRRLALDALRAQNLGAYDRRSQIGFLRNLVVREGRRTGQEQVRLVTSPGEFDVDAFAAALGPVQSLIWTQARRRRRDDAGRPGRADHRHAADRGGARRPALRAQLRGVLPDEHGDGRAALRRRRGVRRAEGLRAGLRPLLRHRHDRADARLARRRGRRRRDRPRGGRGRGVQRARQRDHQRPLHRGRRARGAEEPDRGGRRAPTSSSSTRRAPGCRRRSSRRIAESNPKRIVYVSCNPTTLAPNAAQLVEAGYKLVRVRPVDQFPQTPHIECVALLERVA